MKRVLLASLVVGLGAVGALASRTPVYPTSNQKIKDALINKVKTSTSIPIFADNTLGCLLQIQEATVKEISGDDFSALVGETSRYLKQCTFPEVTLLNQDSRTITSFALLAQSNVDPPKSGYILLKRKLSIPPNEIHTVSGSEWPQAERVSIQKDGRFVLSLRQPPLDSPRSWIPGCATDLKVTVGLVEYSDGAKWKLPSGSNW